MSIAQYTWTWDIALIFTLKLYGYFYKYHIICIRLNEDLYSVYEKTYLES